MKFDFLKRSMSFILVISILLGAFSFSALAEENDTDVIIEITENADVDVNLTENEDAVSEIDGDNSDETNNLNEDFYFSTADLAEIEEESVVDWSAVESALRVGLENFSEYIDLSDFNIDSTSDNFKMLRYVICYRLPEYFIIQTNVNISTGNGIVRGVSPEYPAESESEYNLMRTEFFTVADKLLTGIEGNDDLDDVIKALLLHDRISDICEYDTDNYDAQYNKNNIGKIPTLSYTAYGILVNNIGVCAGYSSAYFYLLNRVGIQNEVCTSEKLNHAWNIVFINGQGYYVDVTWDDCNGKSRIYFMRSYDKFGHVADDYNTSYTDTTYDDYNWPLYQLLNDELYYASGRTIKRYSDDTVIIDIGNYSDRSICLFSDEEFLYYYVPNTMNNTIYIYDPINDISEEYLKPQFPEGSVFSINDCIYENDHFKLVITYKEKDDVGARFTSLTFGPRTCGEDLVWNYKNGVLKISGKGTMYDYSLSKVAPWYEYKDEITMVVIEDEVTSIGDYAFYGLTECAEFIVEGSVDLVGDNAFAGCDESSFVVYCLRESCVDEYSESQGYNYKCYLGNYGERSMWDYNNGEIIIFGPKSNFRRSNYLNTLSPWKDYSDNIESLVVDYGVKFIEFYSILKELEHCNTIHILNSEFHIKEYEFSKLINIENIYLPNGITDIPEFVFSYCENLKTITIPDSVEIISSGAFGYSGIEQIVVPDSVTCLGEGAFYGCSKLGEVSLSNNIELIPTRLFYGCSNLDFIKIPDSVKKIETDAFKKCSENLTVYIPDNVESISNKAFSVSDNVTILCGEGSYAETYAVENGINFKYATGTFNTWSWLLEDGVLTISGDENVYNATTREPAPWTTEEYIDLIKHVVIEEGIATLGNYLFKNCTKLESVALPSTLTAINNYVFQGCTSLKEITLPDNVTKVGLNAFSGCSSLESFDGGKSLRSLSSDLFKNCTFLTRVKVPYCTTTFSNIALVFDGCDLSKLTVICAKGSVIESRANTDGINYECYIALDTENYNVNIYGASDISNIRYASGVHDSASSIKNAPDCYGMSATKIANYVSDGIFKYEMPNGGTYTFHIKYADGTEYIEVVDVTNMTQKVTVDGVTITLNNLYGVRDFFIAKGEWNTYSEIKENGYVVRVTDAKINGAKKYSYAVKEEGTYTVLVRYTDETKADYAIKPVVIDVETPTYAVNGLQITVGNLDGVKAIRTAYGEYATVSEIKKASGYRTFTQSVIKGNDEYTIQYREGGTVTVAVQYTNGYTDIVVLEVEQKQSTMVQEGNTVTFGNLEGLQVLRYAEGEYETSSEIKNATGSRAAKADKIDENGNIVITLAKAGTYTFCVQYLEGSFN